MTVKSCQIDNYSLRPLKREVGVCISCSVMSDSVTTWAVARQAPLSMGVSRQEYWGGLPCPSPGDLPEPEIESGSPALQADSLLSEPPGESSV